MHTRVVCSGEMMPCSSARLIMLKAIRSLTLHQSMPVSAGTSLEQGLRD